MRRWMVLVVVALLVMPVAAMAQEATPFVPENPLGVPTDVFDGEGIRIDYFSFEPFPGISDGSRNYLFVGEMTNITQSEIIAPALQLTFTDENGSIYWQNQTYPTQSHMAPGSKSAFYMSLPSSALLQAYGASSLEVIACHTELFSNGGGDGLSITSPGMNYATDEYLFSGQVELTNTGTVDIEQPAIYLISRDQSGMVDFVDMEILTGPVRPGAFTRDHVYLRSPHEENVTFSADEFGFLSVGCPRP